MINAVIIFSIIFATPSNPYLLAFGYVFSIILATIILIYYAFKVNITQYSFIFSPFDGNFVRLCMLAVPIGLSLFVNQINGVIDRIFSSSLGEGVTSALSYANRLQLLPYSLVVSVFILVCTPRINKYFAEFNYDQAMFYVKKAFMLSFYLSLPIVLILLFFSAPIIHIIFQRGAFTSQSTIITAECLFMYALGLPFYAFREIATTALTANLKKYAILKNTTIAVILNILMI